VPMRFFLMGKEKNDVRFFKMIDDLFDDDAPSCLLLLDDDARVSEVITIWS
jgi:hypothetical protein